MCCKWLLSTVSLPGNAKVSKYCLHVWCRLCRLSLQIRNLEECTGIVWYPVNGTVPFVNVGLSHYLQTIRM